MMGKSWERLAWERLDGEISAEDLRTLEAHLASHPDAREELEEMHALVNLFDQIEDLEPPGELRRRTVREIDRRPVPADASWWASLKGLFAPDLTPRLAWGATGLLAGIIGALLTSGALEGPDPVDVSSLYGAMGVHRAEQALRLGSEEWAGEVFLQRQQERLLVDLRCPDAKSTELRLALPGLAFEELTESSPGSSRLSLEEGRLLLRVEGPGRYLVASDAAAAGKSLTVAVRFGGELVLEETVQARHIPEISSADSNF